MNSPEVSSPKSPGSAGSGDVPLSETARSAFADLKSGAREAMSAAKDQAGQIPDRQRTQAADRLHKYGEAIHETAKKAEPEDPNVAWLTHSLADRVDRVADYLRENDFQKMRGDVETFARRHPAAFLGGLFVAGLAVGSLIKVSGRALAETNSSSDEDDTSDGQPASSGGGSNNDEDATL